MSSKRKKKKKERQTLNWIKRIIPILSIWLFDTGINLILPCCSINFASLSRKSHLDVGNNNLNDGNGDGEDREVDTGVGEGVIWRKLPLLLLLLPVFCWFVILRWPWDDFGGFFEGCGHDGVNDDDDDDELEWTRIAIFWLVVQQKFENAFRTSQQKIEKM